MKKLGKLKLNNFSEMSEQEMKFVIEILWANGLAIIRKTSTYV